MMSGNKWALSPGRRLAIAACIAVSAGLGLAGCNDTNSANTGPASNAYHGPTGTIQGSVVDNNGNPLKGVVVTTSGQQLTTAADGQFLFHNVPVNCTLGSTAITAGCPNAVITITMQPPAGNLGGTVTVTAAAQNFTSQQATGGNTQNNPQTTFVDGYTVGTGPIDLPATNASMNGTLRNAANQAPLAGVPVYAQFLNVIGTTSNQAGIAVVYATGAQTANGPGTSDANGNFSFSNLPANSCVSLYVPQFNLTLGGSDVTACTPTGTGSSTSTADIDVSTANSPVTLNQIFAAASPNASTFVPYVTNVAHVLNEAAAPAGQLDSTVGSTLVITFADAINYQPAANNPLTVLVGSGANLTQATISSATFDSTKTVLTLALASALPNNAAVKVNLPVQSFVDVYSGNLLSAGVTTVPPEVGFDGGGVVNGYVVLSLNTFVPGAAAGPFSMSQNYTAQNAAGDPLKAFSNAFNDVVGTAGAAVSCTHTSNFVSAAGGCTTNTKTLASVTTGAGNGISQLNAQEFGPSNFANVGVHLSKLSVALGAGTGVRTDVARVTVNIPTPFAQPADLAFTVTDINGNPKSMLFFPVNTTNGPNAPYAEGGIQVGLVGGTQTKAAANNSTAVATANISNGGNAWYGINPNGNTSFDVVIVNGNAPGFTLQPGDILYVVSRSQQSGQYVLGTEQMLTLKDGVDPTVALQFLGQLTGSAATAALGEGGVVQFGGSAGTAGTVVFAVTPQLGDTSDASLSPFAIANFYTASEYPANEFHDELFLTSGLSAAGATDASYGTVNATTTAFVAAPGATDAYVDSKGNLRTDYDATGAAAYLANNATAAGSQNVPTAIAVDEAVTSAASLAVPYSGAAVLSGFATPSNAVSSKQTSATGTGIGTLPPLNPANLNDLVTFNVNNLFTLAADNGKLIDLTGTITDLAGNAAAAGDNAKVVVADLFPPLMTLGYTNGTVYVFQFNEPVQLFGTISLDNCGATTDLHADATAATPTAALSNGNKTVTVQAGAFTGGAGSCFYPSSDTKHTYTEAGYTTATTGVPASQIPAKLQHGFVSYNNVPDALGNVWDGAVGGPVTFDWAAIGAGMGAPHFAIANLVGPLTISSGFSNFVVSAGATTFTANITSNQPLANLLQASGTVQNPANPAEVAIYSTGVTVTAGFGANPCAGTDMTNAGCKAFVNHNLVITGACATPTPAGSTATVTATGITFTINCPSIATGDTATLEGDSNIFESQVVDPNTGKNLTNTFGAGPTNMGKTGA